MPLIAMFAGLAVTAAAAIILQPRYHETGVAAAIALGAWTSAAVLIVMLLSRQQFIPSRAASLRLVRIVIAAAVMGAVLYVARLTTGVDQFVGLVALFGAVAALITLGLVLYLGLLQLSGILRVNELVRALRK